MNIFPPRNQGFVSIYYKADTIVDFTRKLCVAYEKIDISAEVDEYVDVQSKHLSKMQIR